MHNCFMAIIQLNLVSQHFQLRTEEFCWSKILPHWHSSLCTHVCCCHKQCNMIPVKGQRCCMAAKVTTGLTECNAFTGLLATDWNWLWPKNLYLTLLLLLSSLPWQSYCESSPGSFNSNINTDIAVRWPKSPHRYWNSRAIWDHAVLPATQQRWHSSLYPLVLDAMDKKTAFFGAFGGLCATTFNECTLSARWPPAFRPTSQLGPWVRR